METGGNDRYSELANKSLTSGTIFDEEIRWILSGDEAELLPLLHAAYRVRYTYFGNKVKIHILNNVQSGGCMEDCKYCAQSGKSGNIASTYPMKSEKEIIKGAELAYEAGAFRHCMVFSGRDMNKHRIEKIASVVKKIKAIYPMEICVSAGFLTKEDAEKLVEAGVDRYNHNLNTSSDFYGRICSTHEYQERVRTIETAKNAGLAICSGVIIGMGEDIEHIIRMARELYRVGADSVPVNFFIPVAGHRIEKPGDLTPSYCLKVLCVFRFAIPKAEIRASAGREYHIRSLQALSLFPANSLFAEGYLTTGGDPPEKTTQMIIDSGFEVDRNP